MAGPNAEETLHWCLRSVVSVADEAILVDNGMSSEAVRIASQYPVQIVQGADPLKHGFEIPRNLGLSRATKDWVLWIDCDERLLNPEGLLYFLRRNNFEGYALTQHNFSCDNPERNEQPVRLFRNNGRRRDGKTISFVGLIHEVPEVGVNLGPGLVG